jgi:hypothetical protein
LNSSSSQDVIRYVMFKIKMLRKLTQLLFGRSICREGRTRGRGRGRSRSSRWLSSSLVNFAD